MVAAEVLELLRLSGVNLRVDGARLIAESNSPLTNDLRVLIRDHKPGLIQALTSCETDASFAWSLIYPDGRTAKAYFCPRVTRERALSVYPEAIDAKKS